MMTSRRKTVSPLRMILNGFVNPSDNSKKWKIENYTILPILTKHIYKKTETVLFTLNL